MTRKNHPHPNLGRARGKIHRGFLLPLFRFLIKTLRNDGQRDDRGVQGIQHHPSFPKSSIGNPKAFNEEDAFSSSVSSLSFAFFAFIFMFLRGVMRGSFSPS